MVVCGCNNAAFRFLTLPATASPSPTAPQAWISAIVASGTTLISIFVGIPLLKRKVQRDMEAQEQR